MDISFKDCDSDDAVLIECNLNKKIHKSISDTCLVNKVNDNSDNVRSHFELDNKKRSFESSDAEGKGDEDLEIQRLFKRAQIECEMKIAQYDRQQELLSHDIDLGESGKCYKFLVSLVDWYENDVNRFLFWMGASYTLVRIGEYL